MPSPKNYLLHYAALPKYGDNSEKMKTSYVMLDWIHHLTILSVKLML